MTEAVAVHILDREYLVGCPPEERESLLVASRLLDARMREIRGAHRMAGIDRVAVLAALNLAHELIQLRQDGEQREQVLQRLLAELNRNLETLSGMHGDAGAHGARS